MVKKIINYIKNKYKHLFITNKKGYLYVCIEYSIKLYYISIQCEICSYTNEYDDINEYLQEYGERTSDLLNIIKNATEITKDIKKDIISTDELPFQFYDSLPHNNLEGFTININPIKLKLYYRYVLALRLPQVYNNFKLRRAKKILIDWILELKYGINGFS